MATASLPDGERCYACFERGSDAPTACYFSDPDLAQMEMHAVCFVECAAWLETGDNLRRILSAWAHCTQHARVLRSRILLLVRRWQRELWPKWEAELRTQSGCRFAFVAWSRVAEVLLPELWRSSTEESDSPPET